MSEKCMIQAGFTKQEIKELFGEVEFSDINVADITRAIKGLEDQTNEFKIQGVKQLELLEYLENYGQNTDIDWNAKNRSGSMFGAGGRAEGGLTALISTDLNEVSGVISTSKRMEVIQEKTYTQIGELMEFMTPQKRGLLRAVVTNKAANPEQMRMMNDVVDEIMGSNTGNPEARGFAQSMSKALDSLHNQYSALKGKEANLKDWGLPQRHDSLKVRDASSDEWLEFTWDLLDIELMMKNNPDLKTRADLMKVLEGVYQSIRSHGISKIKADPLQKMSLHKRNGIENLHKDHRFLQFKDGNNWRSYQDKFGTGSVYQSITDHITSLSREIALMERFGPDYDAGFAYAKSQTMRMAEAETKGGGEQAGNRAEAYFNEAKGLAGSSPHPIARGLQVLKNAAVWSKLGMAPLSATSDHVFALNRAHFNGMAPMKHMALYAKALTSPKFRKFAKQQGFVTDMSIDRVSSSFNHMDNMNNGKTKALADLSLRASGLTLHTEVARVSHNMNFNFNLARRSLEESWENLEPNTKRLMERYGVDEKDWAVIKDSPRTEYDGQSFLDIEKMPAKTQDKIIGAMLSEMDYAVPTPGSRERTIARLGTEAGTIPGEMIGATMQFQSFGITTFIQNVGRVVYADVDRMNKIQYVAATAVMSTMMGAFAMQLKNAAVGKTPEDMDTSEFWIKAMSQGGAIGILGNFLLNTEGYQHGMGAGPVFDGPVKDLAYTLVLGNVNKLRSGEDTSFSKDSVDFIRKNFPGNNIWWTRLAIDRALTDQMRKLSDPNWRQTQRSHLNKMRNKGQEYWWKPGELTP